MVSWTRDQGKGGLQGDLQISSFSRKMTVVIKNTDWLRTYYLDDYVFRNYLGATCMDAIH